MVKPTLLLLAATLALPASAQAACDSTDIGGNWALYATMDGSEFWTFCRLNLNSTGRLSGGKSNCKTVGQPRSDIFAAEFAVSNRCRVTGYFGVSGDRQDLNHAWMSKNGQMFSGVGHNSTTNFAFTAIRK